MPPFEIESLQSFKQWEGREFPATEWFTLSQDRIQKFSDSDPKKCPKCGAGKLERLLHAPAVQFKGSGWYATDYPSKGAAEAAKKESGVADGSAAPTKDKEKTDSKPKSDTKSEARKK